MIDTLKVEPRKLQSGAGIYEAGDTSKCYLKLFITDGGRAMSVNHRMLTEDDLLTAYTWGREEEREHPLTDVEGEPL